MTTTEPNTPTDHGATARRIIAQAVDLATRGTGLRQDLSPHLDSIAERAWPLIRDILLDVNDVTAEALLSIGKDHNYSKHFAGVIGSALTEAGYVIIRREP